MELDGMVDISDISDRLAFVTVKKVKISARVFFFFSFQSEEHGMRQIVEGT